MEMKRGMLKQFNCSEFAVDGEVFQLCGEISDAGSRAPWQRRLFKHVYFVAKKFYHLGRNFRGDIEWVW